MSPKCRIVRVGKRTEANFRKTDAARVIETARACGLEVAGVEVILGADGSVTFRVLGSNAVTATTPDSGTKVWQTEIEKLKATPKWGKGQ
jgi:hypothetical protein